ncbi:hypothetical protein [Streptacidiphilus cavernicola]|uniref:4Fe-4S Wbl-type domain-containing protein n=1 Tax=Streptacidiphilus cavernicola TaxID=3342716 RepID=A0ABV6W4E1_9ACTN
MTADIDDCTECRRLCEQARAALLSGDRSRLTDVRVFQRRHVEAEHAVSTDVPVLRAW